MYQSTSGIILHTTKYSETSLIAKIYTHDFGLQSCIVSGVRSKKGKNKANLFQPLALVDLVITNAGKGGLQRISEVSAAHPYISIPYHIIKSSIAIFLNEVIYRSLREDHADPDLYEFIKSSLLILDLQENNPANFHIYFMSRLSRYLGFYPQGTFEPGACFDLREGRFTGITPSHIHHFDPALSRIFSALLSSSYENVNEVPMDKNQRRLILQGLIDYYRLHIGNFGEIRSKEVLEAVIG